MSDIARNPIEKSVAKALLGLVAVAMLAPAVSAQYVSTTISSNLFEPNGVATDASGNVYITDSSDNRIVKFVPSSGALTALAGTAGTDTAGTNNGMEPRLNSRSRAASWRRAGDWWWWIR